MCIDFSSSFMHNVLVKFLGHFLGRIQLNIGTLEQGTLVCRCAGVATPAKPVWDFEEKKKKRKRRIFEFFSEFYLLIQGYNHICSGFLCACDPTIKTNRSVQSKEIDVRNSHKKVAYRAPAAQLKMTSGSPQLYPMP